MFKAKFTSKRHTPTKASNKKLTNGASRSKFRAPFKPIETAIILGVILLGISGILYQKHEQKVHEQLDIAPASSQSSDNDCLLNGSSCPSISNSNTPSSAQPTQTTTPSTPSTTTEPANNTSGANCTQTELPPTTTYQDDSSLPSGQTKTVGGFPGLEYKCNGSPTKIVQPVNTIIYVGTGTGASTTTEQPQTSTNQGSTEQYEQCVQSLESQMEVDGALTTYSEQEAQEECQQYL